MLETRNLDTLEDKIIQQFLILKLMWEIQNTKKIRRKTELLKDQEGLYLSLKLKGLVTQKMCRFQILVILSWAKLWEEEELLQGWRSKEELHLLSEKEV